MCCLPVESNILALYSELLPTVRGSLIETIQSRVCCFAGLLVGRRRETEEIEKYDNVRMQQVLSWGSHLLHCKAMIVDDNTEMG